MGVYDELEKCVEIDWDEGNEGKNREKHRVSDAECEAVFVNGPLVAGSDSRRRQSKRVGISRLARLTLEGRFSSGLHNQGRPHPCDISSGNDTARNEEIWIMQQRQIPKFSPRIRSEDSGPKQIQSTTLIGTIAKRVVHSQSEAYAKDHLTATAGDDAGTTKGSREQA